MPDHVILSVDPASARVDRFTDDRDSDLPPRPRTPDERRASNYGGYAGPYGPEYVLGKDNAAALFLLEMADAPAAGATKVLLRGSVAARIACGEASDEEKDVRLAVGTTITAGPTALTIRAINDIPMAPDQPPRLNLTLVASRPMDEIKSVQFFDAEGREIPSYFSRGQYAPDYRGSEFAAQCSLSRDVPRARVKVTHFEKVRKVNVPIDLATGVGL